MTLRIKTIKYEITIDYQQMPSHNGRFGAMAAATPQKRQCEFESLYPAGSSVEAATTPSRHHVSRHPKTAQLYQQVDRGDGNF